MEICKSHRVRKKSNCSKFIMKESTRLSLNFSISILQGKLRNK